MVVWLYIQIFLAWWVTTILYNYGAMLCELGYNYDFQTWSSKACESYALSGLSLLYFLLFSWVDKYHSLPGGLNMI